MRFAIELREPGEKVSEEKPEKEPEKEPDQTGKRRQKRAVVLLHRRQRL